ncbi:MAG: ParB/RepB/Spo0J family partition protein [Clostridiales bacterium]|nr:ParB/RepB/Spo0J family partition protein [Clostridiales bacterium]
MALFTKFGKRQIMELPISVIHPNPYQPRKVFDPESLADLSQSIARLGVLQPLSVRRTPAGWELIAGERRLRAAELAGLSTVPCLNVEADEETSSLLALVENLQRADLDVWEEAAALRRLIDEFHLSQEETARRIGKSQSAVANKLRLLKLPQDVIDGLRDARLTERHARALLRLPDEATQRTALAHIIRFRLNVAQTERYVDKLSCQPNRPKAAVPIYRTRDVRLFLNTLKRSLSLMQSAGVDARCGREETEHEITLTIHIPK